MNVYKIIFMILFTNFCTISGLDNPPELVRAFFKRFSAELGSSPEWTFTTPRIATSWGSCVITDNDITVTIGDQTACWVTPGGPWAIQYTTATETVSLKPQQSFIQPEWTINPPFSQENVFTNITEKLAQLSSIPTPTIPKAPTISAPTISMPTVSKAPRISPKVFKAPTTEEIIFDYYQKNLLYDDSIPKTPIRSSTSSYSLPKNPKLTLPRLAYPQRFYTNDQIVDAAWNWFGWHTLILEPEDIDAIIAEINYYAHINHLQIKEILQALQKKIEDDHYYHQERIEKKHYYKNLALDCIVGIGCCAINIALAGTTYYIYKKWHKGSNDKIENIRHELKNMGIEVKQNRYSYDMNRQINYIDLVYFKPLSDQDFSYARQCQQQLATLANDKDWALQAEICTVLVTLICCKTSIPLLLGVISQRLFPRHQEYCEKLLLIQEKITAQLGL